MIRLDRINEELSEDIQAVMEWSDELYNTYFSKYFISQRELYKKLESKSRPITDGELEEVLTAIPLDLFNASEALSQFKIRQEVVKMRSKQIEAEKVEESAETTVTKKKEDASMKMLEHKLLITVYSGLIARVEGEISFSRELIMGAKKIWDSRKNSESILPINPIDVEDTKTSWSSKADNLPEYYSASSNNGNRTQRTYVK